MRSFVVFSIGLAILVVAASVYSLLYIDSFRGLLDNSYNPFVDWRYEFIPSIELPPFGDVSFIYESTGVPTFPGSYQVYIEDVEEIYIYDVDEFFVVEDGDTLDLKHRAYRVGVKLVDDYAYVRIIRVDGQLSTQLMLATVSALGVLLVLGGLGWRRQ